MLRGIFFRSRPPLLREEGDCVSLTGWFGNSPSRPGARRLPPLGGSIRMRFAQYLSLAGFEMAHEIDQRVDAGFGKRVV
jgi:hypothetical protein